MGSDVDVDVSPWVLELLLRERSNDKRVLAVLPVSDHDGRLKKTVLLRSIETEILDGATVTEAILDSLERIEVLDRSQKVPITDSMRAAYCAVATELTVKFLVPSGGKKAGNKYVEAVEKIWRGRVKGLEDLEGCGLVSTELNERREEVEAGIRDMVVSKKLASLDSRNDALRLVALYVDETLAIMGPQFIDRAVRCSIGKGFGGEQVAVENDDNEQVAEENDGDVGKGREVPVCVVNGAGWEVPMENVVDLTDDSDLEANGAKDVTDKSEMGVPRMNGVEVSNGSEQEAHDTNVTGERRLTSNGDCGVLSFEPATKEKETSRPTAVRRRHGPAKIRDDEDVGTEASVSINDSVSSAEVRKVQEHKSDVCTEASVAMYNSVSSTEVREVQTSHQNDVLQPNSVSSPEVREVQTGHQNDVPQPKSVSSPEVREVQTSHQNDVHQPKSVSSTEVREVQTSHQNDVLQPNSVSSPEVRELQTSHQNDVLQPNSVSSPEVREVHTSHQNVVPQPIGKETCAPNLSIDKGNGMENDQRGDVKRGNPSCSFQNDVPRTGLMEHNSTSRTYEWDDSLGMSPEQTDGNWRFHLPTPKVNAFSQLERYEDERFPKRRRIKRWSSHEEDTLRAGVQKYGRSWKRILEAHRDVFEDRTDVDLKDKWRNMTK